MINLGLSQNNQGREEMNGGGEEARLAQVLINAYAVLSTFACLTFFLKNNIAI